MNPALCGRIVRRWTDAGPVAFRSPADEPSPELTVAIVEVFDFVRFRINLQNCEASAVFVG